MCSNKGITLIELLVVIMIVAILAAIAIPGYTGYMQRARRADAKTVLEQMRAAQEMWRAEKGSYAIDDGNGAALAKLQNTMGAPATTAGDYTLSFTVLGANTFTAQATPSTTRQAGDGWLSIDHNGNKCDQAGKCYPDKDSKWTK
jgi:type IV pilus assembly protein PilE